MKKAWVENNCIRDLADNPAIQFHPTTAAFYSVEVDDSVERGATLVDGEWVNPEPISNSTPSYQILTPMQFYLSFTAQERIAIKTSEDAIVKEFWNTYELAVSVNAQIDPNLTSVRSALEYMADGSCGILQSARVEEILNGILQ